MAIYGPLTDAFNEFNRLLIGQQQFKGQQALAQSNSKRADLMLQSNLQNQAFNREMAQKGLDLRYDQFAEQQGNTEFNQKLALQKMENENDSVQSNLETNRLRQQEIRNNLKAYEDDNKLDVVNMRNMWTAFPEIRENEEAMSNINRLFGEGVDASGDYAMKDGKEHLMSKKDVREKILPFITGFAKQYEDAPLKQTQRLLELESKRADLLNEYSDTSPDGGIGRTKRGFLKAEMNHLDSQIAGVNRLLEPRNQMAYYNDKAADGGVMANWATAYNAKELRDEFMQLGKQAETQSMDIAASLNKKPPGRKGSEFETTMYYNMSDEDQFWNGRWVKPGMPLGKIVKDVINDVYPALGTKENPKAGPLEWMGDIAARDSKFGTKPDEGVKGKGSFGHFGAKVATSLVIPQHSLLPPIGKANPANETVLAILQSIQKETPPTSRDHSESQGHEARDKMEELHDQFYARFVEKRAELDDEKFEIWLEDTYVPNTKKLKFKYAPTGPYQREIRKERKSSVGYMMDSTLQATH